MNGSMDLPPLPALAEQRGELFTCLVELMRRLLAPDGCPWDREQSYDSLRRYVLEEACEVIDAIDGGDFQQLSEELGDLALQVAFLAELGRRDGHFGPDDVMRGICEKLIRRHPHVFGDVEVSGSADVVRNWEAIKREEKGARGLLDSVPRSLPALDRAQRLTQKAARVGFDWPDAASVRAKLDEELHELDDAIGQGDAAELEHELGDVLFALVNLARHHGVDAGSALRRTANRFADRFAHVELRVRERHGGWPQTSAGKPTRGVSLAELDAYWEEAKRERG